VSIAKLKEMYPDLSQEKFEFILWEWTAYPMGGPDVIVKQFRSKIRALKNSKEICWFCAYDINIGHKKWCPDNKRK